jgi:predicted AlkP superfamily pyrophosphatase or phosphodiesterase
MNKTVVINVVGLSWRLLQYTPKLLQWAQQRQITTINPVLPAVTCTAQATYLTGTLPNEHGIVGNGWYFSSECEVKFWRQSNKLVQASKIWEIARVNNPNFSCANLFWWYNMYSSVNYSITPRPMYPADGRKLPDIYTQPSNWRFEIQKDLGQFPLFSFWGPNTSINSTRWIAESAKWVESKSNPTLTLIYLPHLDYCLQKYGHDEKNISKDLQEIDNVCSDLIHFYEKHGAKIIILSEYGITNVSKPIHINRVFRDKGLLKVREELGREILDAGTSKAFAVADHQLAHIYINDPEYTSVVKDLLSSIDGIAYILDDTGKKLHGLNHSRSGTLVAVADTNAWFTYYYWLNDNKAPDFARTVDIHRKPGYDPVELFIDPQIKLPQLKVGLRLLQKQLGFRYLMDVIPLDATLVKGSHGSINVSHEDKPIFISQQLDSTHKTIGATEVCSLILQHLQAKPEPSREIYR